MASKSVYVEHCKGINGLDKIILRDNRGFSTEVIRGGIPICFPQFGNMDSLEQHGFARNRLWSVDPGPPPCSSHASARAFIDLILTHSEDELKIWPHRFEFRFRVDLSPTGDLMLTSRIRNANTDGKERFTEQGDALTFESEVDKIYLITPTKNCHSGPCNEASTLLIQVERKEASAFPIQVEWKEASTLLIQVERKKASTLPIQVEWKEASALSIQVERKKVLALPIQVERKEASTLPIQVERKEESALPIQFERNEASTLSIKVERKDVSSFRFKCSSFHQEAHQVADGFTKPLAKAAFKVFR
ncbi:putative FASCICLIN-like arabinogalactan protein 14 precursor [Hibiscus syriacus]|uniref:FASCICLIN-like arabinogalactan protein 14 n=1 Tax=Hibiscus syriacus TaxID=106335 RepID=A0A6A3AHP3_HIBSY|nr:putative FASCICLIN-like arabinogalactan protein 14 precursor [Hibiscus syriacus]